MWEILGENLGIEQAQRRVAFGPDSTRKRCIGVRRSLLLACQMAHLGMVWKAAQNNEVLLVFVCMTLSETVAFPEWDPSRHSVNARYGYLIAGRLVYYMSLPVSGG